jgi:tRNA/rRNA methyltransferase
MKAEVRVVLVRPRDTRNVGSSCRAMKCMGLTNLAIVTDGLLDPRRAFSLAHNATEILENATMHTDLREAIGDAVLIAGTTRRRGRSRKYFSLFPEQLGEKIAGMSGGTVAVLFGNEETGLTDEELSLCHVAVNIPTAPALPSLNLSHAVQIVCYEIFRAENAAKLTPFTPIPTTAAVELVEVITDSLKSIGFFTLVSPESMSVFWKDIIARAGLSVNEARRMDVTFRKIAGLASKNAAERLDPAVGIDPEPNPP